MLKNVTKSDASNYFKALLFAIISSFAVTVNNGAHKVPESAASAIDGKLSLYIYKIGTVFESPDYSVLLLIIIAVAAYVYLIPKIEKKNIPWGVPFSIVSAVFILLCDSYSKLNSWDNVFGSTEAFVTSVIRGAGIAVPVFFIYDLINRFSIERVENKKDKSSFKKFAALTAIMFACWIPYMVILSPGAMAADTRDQFGQVLGNPDMCWSISTVVREESDILLTNHHPVFHTLLLGAFLKAGELMGSYFIGMEIYSVLQCLIFAGSIVFSLIKLRECGMSKKMSNVFFAFFTLCPLFPCWGMTTFKDTPFTVCLLITTILLYDAFKFPDKFNGKKYFALFIFLLLLMLVRNNGFYMILLLAPFVIIHFRKDKKFLVKIVSVMIIPLLLFKVGYTGIAFNLAGVNEGSPREMLSVPFQQTARYISEYEDEITPEEEKNILAILGGGEMTLNEIADEYVPDRSDNVKRHYNKYAETDDLINYVKTWAAQLAKHPDVYIEAFLNLNYSWFSFNSNHDIIYYDGVTDKKIPEYLEGLNNPESFNEARSVLKQTVRLLDRIPLVSSIFEFSTYTWIYVIIFLAMLMRKKHTALLACLPIFVNYVICFVGPVAYMRYVIPMVVCLPFVLFITFSKRRSEDEIKNTKENEIWIK